MPTRLLTVTEAATVLADHPETLRQRLRRGELTGVKKGDGPRARWYVTEKALDAYINRRSTR